MEKNNFTISIQIEYISALIRKYKEENPNFDQSKMGELVELLIAINGKEPKNNLTFDGELTDLMESIENALTCLFGTFMGEQGLEGFQSPGTIDPVVVKYFELIRISGHLN
ncbi:hypothetical protein HA402_001904 [Bradysia odoriphaga]|nr:hypothetical protein HA402_001904 [Bradysia odoriphaga]